jgi:integrase
MIAKIGQRAGVVVNKPAGKYASAHDLRRAFGTRWAPKVKPPTLQLLMRHRSLETTLRYYVDIDADDVADELWRSYGELGSSLGSSSPFGTPHSERGVPHGNDESRFGQSL